MTRDPVKIKAKQERRKLRERERRQSLVNRLGGVCAKLSVQCNGPLHIDHKHGRDYKIESLGGNRLKVYEQEEREGKLRVLCEYHNTSDGARKRMQVKTNRVNLIESIGCPGISRRGERERQVETKRFRPERMIPTRKVRPIFQIESVPVNILSLEGGICSGKSWLIKKLREEFAHVAWWDIADFYERRGCFRHGRIDWKIWRTVEPFLVRDLLTHLKEHRTADVFIIESSGANERLNVVISTLKAIRIKLENPSANVLEARKNGHSLSLDEITKFNKRLTSGSYTSNTALIRCRNLLKMAKRRAS